MLNQTQTQTTDEPDGGIDILDDGVRLSTPDFSATYQHPEGFSGAAPSIPSSTPGSSPRSRPPCSVTAP